MSATDTQVGGDHYRTCKIQPVEFIEVNRIAFLDGALESLGHSGTIH